MDPKVVIVSCTQKPPLKNSEVLLYQSFESGGMEKFSTLDMVWNNSEGLPAVYNRKITEYAGSDVEFLAFVHDDVYIDDQKLCDKLKSAYTHLGFQIIGVAGAAVLNIKYPSLWHLMADRKHRRGFVHHSTGGTQTEATNFGPTPAEVIMMDGLFIAIHLPSILAAGWRFNENYKFHHYDISSCLDAFKMGLKMGVFPIHLIHLSSGLSSVTDKVWKESNDRFLAEYGPKEPQPKPQEPQA
jgi:Glycosyltransferase like family